MLEGTLYSSNTHSMLSRGGHMEAQEPKEEQQLKKNRVQAYRFRAKMSQNKLAKETGCSVRTISRIEQGYEPSPKIQTRIAHVFQVSISELFPSVSEHSAEVLPFDPTTKRISATWLERAYKKPAIPFGFPLETYGVEMFGHFRNKSVPMLNFLNTYLQQSTGRSLPVICGPQGSGKTAAATLLARNLYASEGLHPFYVSLDLLNDASTLFESVQNFLSTVYGDEYEQFRQPSRGEHFLLILDGLEALLRGWSLKRAVQELENLHRSLLTLNFAQKRIYTLLTCNSIVSKDLSSKLPSFDFINLDLEYESDQDQEKPSHYMQQWWKVFNHNHKRQVDLGEINSLDYGYLCRYPLGNAYLAQHLLPLSGQDFMLKPQHMEQYFEFLHSKSWQQGAMRVIDLENFTQLGQALAFCSWLSESDGFFTQKDVLGHLEKLDLSAWAKSLRLDQAHVLSFLLTQYPLDVGTDGLSFIDSTFMGSAFTGSAMRDWLLARYIYETEPVTSIGNARDITENLAENMQKKYFKPLSDPAQGFLYEIINDTQPEKDGPSIVRPLRHHKA